MDKDINRIKVVLAGKEENQQMVIRTIGLFNLCCFKMMYKCLSAKS